MFQELGIENKNQGLTLTISHESETTENTVRYETRCKACGRRSLNSKCHIKVLSLYLKIDHAYVENEMGV
jgi:hypothetical protein